MIPIRAKYRTKFRSNTFLQIEIASGKFIVGNSYAFEDYYTQEILIIAVLISKRTIERSQLTDDLTLLNNDCTVEIHNKIESLHRIPKDDDMLDIMIFSHVYDIAEFNKTKEITNGNK